MGVTVRGCRSGLVFIAEGHYRKQGISQRLIKFFSKASYMACERELTWSLA